MDIRFILYNIVTVFAIPVILATLLMGRKYRQGLRQRLGFIPNNIKERLTGERPVWFHAVSVGEVIASIPIVKKLKQKHPQLKVVFSTITATGNYTARQKIPEVDAVMYFPYDYFFIVNKVIRAIDPCLFIHTETEIWPNFLWVLHRRRIPSVIVNGRLSSKSSRRYKAFGWFFKTVFDKIAAFGVQSQVDYDRVIDMGVDPSRVLLSGNMKYDQNISEAIEVVQKDVRERLNLSADDQVFIGGSTHAGEEEIVLNVFQKLLQEYPQLVLILAPRHPERFQEVERMIKRRGLAVERKTAIDGNAGPHGHPQVILLDTIGELFRVYGIGDVIFVGGSLVNIGGHNILEPVVHKKPVIFGPWMQNFFEIASILRESGAGVLVHSEDEFLRNTRRILDSKEEAQRLGEQGFTVIQQHQGATLRNMEIIDRFITNQ